MGPALQAAADERDPAERRSQPTAYLSGVNHHAKPESRPSGPPRSLKGHHAADLARLGAARSGDAAHARRFIKEMSGTVWSACRVLTRDASEARAVFGEIVAALAANRFARLSAYSGRGTLDTFVALTVRELLAERMLRLLQADPKDARRTFEQLFEADIARLIRKRLSGSPEEMRRDAYQDVCLALIDDGYRRLKAYGGSGSFAGFVLKTVDHLLVDLVRGVVGRRRPLPKCVSVDQMDDIANDQQLSPEECLMHSDEDRQLTAAIEALTGAMNTLGPDERLYLTIALGESSAPPAREIARLMQRPVEEIYKLKQRVLTSLRDIVSKDSKIKTWRASVK